MFTESLNHLSILTSTAYWTDFVSTGCSASCGEGTETFVRTCEGAGECEGEAVLQQPCTDLPVCGKLIILIVTDEKITKKMKCLRNQYAELTYQLFILDFIQDW